MKIKTTLLFLLIISIVSTISLSTAFAQYEPHTQVGLPEGAIARFGTGPFWGVFGNIIAFSQNPNVPQFAVPGILGIWLYDAETLQIEGLLHAPYPDVFCMSYSLDGKLLATGHYDGTIRLWNLLTTELDMTFTPDPTVAYWDETDELYRHTFTRFERIIRSVTFSPDRNILAAGIDNGTIELWDVNTGEVRILEGHNETVDSSVKMKVSFSNDGNMLASTSLYSEVHLWDVATGTLRKTLGKQSWGATNVSFSPDGNTMATYNHTGLHLWDVETYKLLQTFDHAPELVSPGFNTTNISFSPDGSTIVTYTYDRTSYRTAVYLWDVPTNKLRDVLRGPYDFVEAISYSANGNILAATTSSGIFLWYVNWRGSPYVHFQGQVLNPQTAISPDGKTLATGRLLWDLSTGTRKYPVLDSPNMFLSRIGTTAIKNVLFSPDGRTLAISEFNTVMLFDATTGTLLHTINGHVGRPQDVESMAFSPDSSLLATGSVFDFDSLEKGELFLWNVTTGQRKKDFIEHVDNVYSLSFSPDGTTLAAGTDDTVHLMDAKTGEIFDTFPKKGGIVYSLSFSPDGKTLATGSDDKVRLWDVTTGTIRTTFDTIFAEHTPNIRSVKFSPDGKTLAASIYNTVHLWDVATRDISAILRGHVDDVYSVNFSPDGSTLASGSTDGTVLLWKIEVPKQLKRDINDDGVVNIHDLVMIASQFGLTGENRADVNSDGVVNIQDLVLVAAAFSNASAAPTARRDVNEHLTIEVVQQWLVDAKQLARTDATTQRGIAVLESFLTALTPKKTALLPNYPNPFNPETWIPYQLAKPAEVTLRIYTANGKIVRRLAIGQQPVGIYQSRSRAAYWDGRNEVGESVASGIYFCTLKAGEFSATRKMLIRK